MSMTRRCLTLGGAAAPRFASALMAVALAGGALAGSGHAAAQAARDIPAEILKCRDITAGPERLACYDQAAGRLADAAKAAPGPIVMAPAAQVRPEPKPVDPVRDFGAEKLVTADDESKPELEQLIDKVSTVTELGSGRVVIALANGQIWASKESVNGFIHKGDDVRIEKGVLGGYLMIVGDVHPFRGTRIK